MFPQKMLHILATGKVFTKPVLVEINYKNDELS